MQTMDQHFIIQSAERFCVAQTIGFIISVAVRMRTQKNFIITVW